MNEESRNKLLIATNNRGKVRELRELLKETGLTLLTPADINLDLDVEEDGNSYAENASRKAIEFSKESNLVSLADDSGLEVEVLNGAPGLYSARYSPQPGATDADRRRLLLENLRSFPRPWHARFHATLAIAKPTGEVEICEGVCHGEIIPQERGTGGFGYDSIFLLGEIGRTMAELDMEQKNTLSHRAQAAKGAIPILEKIFRLKSPD